MSDYMMNQQAQDESRALSKEILKPILEYQKRQGSMGNQSHTKVILGAIAFVTGVVIGRLPKRHYDEANDFFQENLKTIREELRP